MWGSSFVLFSLLCLIYLLVANFIAGAFRIQGDGYKRFFLYRIRQRISTIRALYTCTVQGMVSFMLVRE